VCGETKTEEIPCLDPIEPEAVVTRIFGDSRVSTAIAVADKLKEVLDRECFDAIIIANGNNFADALTGSYLASVKEAPILLYRANGIALNEEYIRNNLAEDGIVYILGGTAAVPADVEERLIAAGFEVERLYGNTRYATNLKILETAGVNNEEILICTGIDYADSLAASATGLPIVMVNNITGKLTEEQLAFFEAHAANKFTIVGGNAAVSDTLQAKIETIVGPVDRVYGDSRETTSVAIADRYFTSPECILAAYSRNFPDGLCGGPLAYAMNAPLLLVNSGKEAPAANFVKANSIVKGIILGGTAAVSDESVHIIFAD
jgi:putative cell wall-binding protein